MEINSTGNFTSQSSSNVTQSIDDFEADDVFFKLAESIPHEISEIEKLMLQPLSQNIPTEDPFLLNKSKIMDKPVIYFDLETTGLQSDCEIIQLSCVCPEKDKVFNVYMLPSKPISKGASRVSGLTKKRNCVYWKGNAVPTISLKDGLSQLINWLRPLKSSLLVGHNAKVFDCPRLLRALINTNLLKPFAELCCGFSDTWPALKKLLPEKKKYKLSLLMEEFCADRNFSAHNSLDDCKALHAVMVAAIEQHYGILPLSIEYTDTLCEVLAREFFTCQSILNRMASKSEMWS